MCPSRDQPPCVPASRRYRTHDGTCNNRKRPRWGSAQMPFHRFLAPEYADGVEGIRRAVSGSTLPSARFVSLVVHGSRQEEAPVTMMLALWGQLLDHDLTATAQPRSLNGSTPRCCGKSDDGLHPSCLPIKVPVDDPWLSPLGVRCLEFLRSAPAQRRDCLLSWREQTNQVTSFIDASPIYSSNPRTSDNARIFRNGMLLFGRGPPSEDVCFRAALANQCIRPGDARSGEQPGLLMLHMVWVNEHNQITNQLSDINPHWSDEKLYQETRRIVGAMFQHITYREFLPIILGKEVCQLFNLELENSGFYRGYDTKVNPTVANEFSAAAFRFGHSLIQGSYMRADRHHRFILNNVTLHEESADGDLGGPGSLHRLVRGMVNQRALKRDEFITAELTNHLFQTSRFPFGLDLAAINIQRGRDHGIQPYVSWRIPCGLTSIKGWEDLDRVMGPASANRLRKAYRSVDDIDLFVGGLAERPVVGGIVGPTFSCIIAQQFSNLRKGDRFWYENPGFESSFTPAQLESIRQVAFSQVLCRALGGGTLQPHVFLPADIGQNERLACDSKLMAPIDLEPWTERDPFTRPNDSPNTGQSENLIDVETAQSLFSTTSTTRRPTKNSNVVNKVDFIPNANTGLQIPSNGQIIVTSSRPPTTIVNNKLDFTMNAPRPTAVSETTSARPTPQKEPFLTASSAIDNKLDLTGTTVPPKRKPTRKTTPKRRPTQSTNLIINNIDFSLKRDSNGNATQEHQLTKRDLTFINLSKLFTQEDNATLLPKMDSALRHGYYTAPAPPPPDDYDDVNNYDYNTDVDHPVYIKPGYSYDTGYGPVTQQPPPPSPYYGGGGYGPATKPPPPPPNPYFGGGGGGGYYQTDEPPQPPPQPTYCVYNCYNPPMTTNNPYGLDTRRPARTTTPKRGLSNKIVNTDYDYDPHIRQTSRRAQPTRPQPQQPQLQRTTTPRTFYQGPGLIVINDNRPNDKPIFISSSSSASNSFPTLNANVFQQSSKNPSSLAASQSVFSVDPRPQPSSQSLPSPIFSQKKTSHRKPLKELRTYQDLLPSRLITSLGQDYDYDSLIPDANLPEPLNVHDHDGYLRPEQNKYEPLKKTVDLETYRNYNLYNKLTRTSATYEIPTNVSLWTNAELRRYAERYQEQLEIDDDLDQFVGPYIDMEKTHSLNQLNGNSKQYFTGQASTFSTTVHADRSELQTEEQSNISLTDKVDMTDLKTNKTKQAEGKTENIATVYKTMNQVTKYDDQKTKHDLQNDNLERLFTRQQMLYVELNKNRQDLEPFDSTMHYTTRYETKDTRGYTNDKLTPHTNHAIVDAIQNDKFYNTQKLKSDNKPSLQDHVIDDYSNQPTMKSHNGKQDVELHTNYNDDKPYFDKHRQDPVAVERHSNQHEKDDAKTTANIPYIDHKTYDENRLVHTQFNLTNYTKHVNDAKRTNASTITNPAQLRPDNDNKKKLRLDLQNFAQHEDANEMKENSFDSVDEDSKATGQSFDKTKHTYIYDPAKHDSTETKIEQETLDLTTHNVGLDKVLTNSNSQLYLYRHTDGLENSELISTLKTPKNGFDRHTDDLDNSKLFSTNDELNKSGLQSTLKNSINGLDLDNSKLLSTSTDPKIELSNNQQSIISGYDKDKTMLEDTKTRPFDETNNESTTFNSNYTTSDNIDSEASTTPYKNEQFKKILTNQYPMYKDHISYNIGHDVLGANDTQRTLYTQYIQHIDEPKSNKTLLKFVTDDNIKAQDTTAYSRYGTDQVEDKTIQDPEYGGLYDTKPNLRFITGSGPNENKPELTKDTASTLDAPNVDTIILTDRLSEQDTRTDKLKYNMKLPNSDAQSNEDQTYAKQPYNAETSDLLDLTGQQDFYDTHARTPMDQHAIQSILDQTDNSNDPFKLTPIVPEGTDHSKQPRTDDDKPPPTTTNRPRPERRTTTTTQRKRRPTNAKRPIHNPHNPTTNHGQQHHDTRRQPGIALVPFVLLTSIERPDNWVMFNVAKSKKRNPLPEVPQLKSDAFSLSELPKPISSED